VKRAWAALGRPFRIKGRGSRGMQNGSRIGFPTANVPPPDDQVVPSNGIYVIRLRIGERPEVERSFDGVANVGTSRTLDNGPVLVESHLFDVSQRLYDLPVTVEFLERVRDELRFDSVDELRKAIEEDIRFARVWFEREKQGLTKPENHGTRSTGQDG